MFKGLDKRYWLLVIPVIYFGLPWFKYRMKASIPFLMVIAWIFLMMFSGGRVQRNWRKLLGVFVSVVLVLFAFSFLSELWWLFDFGDHLPYNLFAPIWLEGCALFIPYYTFKFGRYREYALLTILLLVGFLVTGILSHSVSVATGGMELSRTLTSESTDEFYLQDVYTAKSAGVGGYDYIYECALLIPVLFLAGTWHLKSRPALLKVFAGLTTFSMYYCIKSGGLGTPMFVLLVGLLLALIFRLFRRKVVVHVVGSAFLLAICIYTYVPSCFSPFASLLRGLGSMLDEGSIRTRFEVVADALGGSQNSYGYTRYERQRESLEAFMARPFSGIGAYYVGSKKVKSFGHLRSGGHSMLFDSMAYFGIWALLLYVAFWVCVMRFYGRLSRDAFWKDWTGIPLVYMYSFIFASIANPFHTFFAVFYFVPGIVMCFCWAEQWARMRRIRPQLMLGR